MYNTTCPFAIAVALLLSEMIKLRAPNSSFSFRDRTYLLFTKKSTRPDFIMNSLSPISPWVIIFLPLSYSSTFNLDWMFSNLSSDRILNSAICLMFLYVSDFFWIVCKFPPKIEIISLFSISANKQSGSAIKSCFNVISMFLFICSGYKNSYLFASNLFKSLLKIAPSRTMTIFFDISNPFL